MWSRLPACSGGDEVSNSADANRLVPIGRQGCLPHSERRPLWCGRLARRMPLCRGGLLDPTGTHPSAPAFWAAFGGPASHGQRGHSGGDWMDGDHAARAPAASFLSGTKAKSWRERINSFERTCRLKRFWDPLSIRQPGRFGPKYRLRGHSRPLELGVSGTGRDPESASIRSGFLVRLWRPSVARAARSFGWDCHAARAPAASWRDWRDAHSAFAVGCPV